MYAMPCYFLDSIGNIVYVIDEIDDVDNVDGVDGAGDEDKIENVDDDIDNIDNINVSQDNAAMDATSSFQCIDNVDSMQRNKATAFRICLLQIGLKKDLSQKMSSY